MSSSELMPRHTFTLKASQPNLKLRGTDKTPNFQTTSPVVRELRRHPLTPLCYAHFQAELHAHPDRAWVSWLLDAIKNGVRIGYEGTRDATIAPNLHSSLKHPQAIDREIQKECEAGRLLGPFPLPPIQHLKCSGVGAVPKKNGKWRMIYHLSAPAGSSVNDHIPKDAYSLHYSSVDDATQILSHLGRGAFLAKVDLQSAFRQIPVHSDDWNLLGIRWRQQYYVDTCLPFGLRSAPYLFNQFAEALHWVLQNNYHLNWLIHYLDDYLIMATSSPQCLQQLTTFLEVCKRLGIPIAMEKVDGPVTVIVFLGLELDTVQQQIRLPKDKLEDILRELHMWQLCKKATKRELLSLIGSHQSAPCFLWCCFLWGPVQSINHLVN